MVIGEQGLAALALGKFEEVYEIEGIYNIIYVPESFLGDFSSIFGESFVDFSSIFGESFVDFSSIFGRFFSLRDKCFGLWGVASLSETGRVNEMKDWEAARSTNYLFRRVSFGHFWALFLVHFGRFLVHFGRFLVHFGEFLVNLSSIFRRFLVGPFLTLFWVKLPARFGYFTGFFEVGWGFGALFGPDFGRTFEHTFVHLRPRGFVWRIFFTESRYMIPASGARNEYEHARRMFLPWPVLP
jgi:hypothetical protein